MRKLVLAVPFLAVLVALAVPAAALARPVERGDGTLAVKNATGRVTVYAKGTMLGRVVDGQLTILDLSPNGDNEVQVVGYDRKPQLKPNGAAVYTGSNMRFRIVGGAYSAVVTGSGIGLSAVGRGTVLGQGITDGLFSTDGLPFKTVPPLLYSGAFGQQLPSTQP
jgi:hypothetical protein